MTALNKPPTWALETVYPGVVGTTPWAGQTCKLQPPGDLWIPNAGDVAEYSNWLDNAITAEQALAHDRDLGIALCVWGPIWKASTVIGTGGSPVDGALAGLRWDDFRKRWALNPGGGGAATSLNVPVTYDSGLLWEEGVGGGRICTNQSDFAFSPENGGSLLQYIPSFGGNFGFEFWSSGGGSATGAGISGLGAMDPGGAVAYFNGQWMVFATKQTGGSFTCQAIRSSTVTPAGSADFAAVTLPAGLASGTNHVGTIFEAHAPALEMVCLPGVTPGTDSPLFMTSPDGTTWTQRSPVIPNSFLNPYVVTAIHYSPVDNLWAIMTFDGTKSYLYTSATPTVDASWVSVHTFNGRADGLNSVGRGWVTTFTDLFTSSTKQRLAISTNLFTLGANATWTAVPFPSIPDGVGTYVKPRIRSSGTQLVVWNDTWFRFSACAGLTAPSKDIYPNASI